MIRLLALNTTCTYVKFCHKYKHCYLHVSEIHMVMDICLNKMTNSQCRGWLSPHTEHMLGITIKCLFRSFILTNGNFQTPIFNCKNKILTLFHEFFLGIHVECAHRFQMELTRWFHFNLWRVSMKITHVTTSKGWRKGGFGLMETGTQWCGRLY